MEDKPKITFIVGPTAAGKTEAAVKLAKKINAEIISCDSMQVYQGMDILTSKPSAVLIRQAPHHLINILAPTREYNVAKFYKDVEKKIKEIRSRGKEVLLVGGTGLYMTILLEGIFKIKTESASIRESLYKEAQRKGSLYLYNRLKKIDRTAASRIHPNDLRRIVRALEVFKVTGKPISELQKQRSGLAEKYDVRIFCLDLERGLLYKRIDQRVDKMFRRGLLNEVRELLKLKLSRTAFCSIGIKELKGYLEGLYSLDETRELIKKNTRNFAKRQLTWFRKDKRIEWIHLRKIETPASIAERLYKRMKVWNERC